MSEVLNFINYNFKDGDPDIITKIENRLIEFLGPLNSYRFLTDENADPETQGLSYLPGKRVEVIDYDPNINLGDFNLFEFYSYMVNSQQEPLKYIRVAIDLGSAEEHYVLVNERDLDRWNTIAEKYRTVN